jgi:hypothetical protein
VSIGTEDSAAEPEPEPGTSPSTRKKWRLALIALVGSYLALASYGLASVPALSGTAAARASGAASASHTTSGADSASAVAAAPASIPAPGPKTGPAPHSLGVASVSAFGPEGTADGDNPGLAARALDVSMNQPWYSQWYATPAFGNLRSGTGLLLDMGKTVTVTDVRLVLGSGPGAVVQLRVGNIPSLTDLPSVATVQDASGGVQLTAPTATKGRYALIWFTRLPPDGQGHYQVSVYQALVDGIAGS